VRFKAVPGHAGHVWLVGGKAGLPYGLWRSVAHCASFVRLPDVDEGDAVGFGRVAPGPPYPAIFLSARVRGVFGIFRSDDEGRRWERVNDDQHQYAWTGSAITGDPCAGGSMSPRTAAASPVATAADPGRPTRGLHPGRPTRGLRRMPEVRGPAYVVACWRVLRGE
jgi:hypothetical protein